MFVIIASVCARQTDSLRFSIGYGTLYGGGLGMKYMLPLNSKIKLHFAISPFFLPEINHNESLKHHFVNIYKNIDKRFEVYKEEDVKICYNKLIIPFAVNVSYPIKRNFDVFFGLGTIANVYDFVTIKYNMRQVYLIEFYKLFASNLSLKVKVNRLFGSFSFSSLLLPLRTYGGESGDFSKDKFTINQFAVGFSFGYYLF